MKKFKLLFITSLLVFTLFGCSNNGVPNTNSNNNIDSSTEKVKDDAMDMGEDIKDGAGSVTKGVTDGASDVTKGVSDGIKDVGDGVKDATDKMTDKK